MWISRDHPNPDIYDFKAKLYYNLLDDQYKSSEEGEELGNLQFIPRGSTMKFSG